MLTIEIRKIHTASRETYGAPRVHAELSAQNVPCCRNTVAKLMRQASIIPKSIRRFRVTTDSRRTKALPNLIGRVFTTDSPNACWLSDITYLPTREGWLYLAAVLDVYSRAIVGWAMSRTLDCKLAKDALSMAIGRRGPPAILHSDQGTTYAAAEYRELVGRYDPAEHEPQGRLPGHSVYDCVERPAQPDSCWDWPTCLGVDLSVAARRSPSVAGPRVCDLIGALFLHRECPVCERLAMRPHACRRTGYE
jgi:transposase InsO family protein